MDLTKKVVKASVFILFALVFVAMNFHHLVKAEQAELPEQIVLEYARSFLTTQENCPADLSTLLDRVLGHSRSTSSAREEFPEQAIVASLQAFTGVSHNDFAGGVSNPYALLTGPLNYSQQQVSAQQQELQQQKQQGFPEEAEVEYEKSVIRIPLKLPNPKRPVDIMAFDAYMRLIREKPVRNEIGYRQFEFKIDAWELTNAYSKGVNGHITFTLSKTVQPKSICIALQKESDFPAIIIYNAIYDIYLDKRRIAENRPGVAFATGVMEIPPRNVTVAFDKPFESKEFSFRPGTCEGMRKILREEFERGEGESRRFRGL